MTTQTSKFEASKSYGNDLTIEVISRTEKMMTIKTRSWGVQKIKIKYDSCGEKIYFKCWVISAWEKFDFEEARKISYEKYYN
jgi:hypothetical protein